MVATTRSVFDRQLNELQGQILQVFNLVAAQMEEAVKALQKHDMDLARKVDQFDKTINQMRYELEEKSYVLLALQQPNGRDMRRIVSTVSIVTNLERMGDHAAGIARLVLRMENTPKKLYIPEFDEMVELSMQSLQDCMKALETEDMVLARAVVSRDDEIDHLHQSAYDQLLQLMIDDPSSVECATMMLWVSHNLERYADRISNICERIVYMVTGELHKPRSDNMP